MKRTSKFGMSVALSMGLIVLLLAAMAVGCATDYGPEIDRLQSELEAAETRINQLETSKVRSLLGERKREIAKPSQRRAVREWAKCRIETFFEDSAAEESLVDEMEKELWVGLDPYNSDELELQMLVWSMTVEECPDY